MFAKLSSLLTLDFQSSPQRHDSILAETDIGTNCFVWVLLLHISIRDSGTRVFTERRSFICETYGEYVVYTWNMVVHSLRCFMFNDCKW
jgi:hypothetical protein